MAVFKSMLSYGAFVSSFLFVLFAYVPAYFEVSPAFNKKTLSQL